MEYIHCVGGRAGVIVCRMLLVVEQTKTQSTTTPSLDLAQHGHAALHSHGQFVDV
jgi:hypothetical protein